MTGKPKKPAKLDVGSLQVLHRDYAFEYCSDFAWHIPTGRRVPLSGVRNQFGRDVFSQWMTSDKRRVILPDDVVFDPTGKCAPRCLNLFDGIAMAPAGGDCEPILELLRHLCADLDPIYEWVLDWIAYPLQNLGAKMPTSIIMHGDEGSGKNLFWESIVRVIYGKYGRVVGQHQLEDKFNDWLSRLLFAVCDEVLSQQQERRHHKGALKAMISGCEITINTKFQAVRTETNHVNLVFLSNEIMPNALDASDRRYCVIWTPPKRDQLFYQRVAHCIRHGGIEAFYAELLKRDLRTFEPFSPPPSTGAKADLVDLGRSSVERWWHAWIADEIDVPFRTCSSDQAYRLYRRWCNLKGERNPLAHVVFSRTVMRISGDLLSTRQVKLQPGGTPCRMWMTEPAPQGETLGRWARDQVDRFAALMQGFCHEE